VLQKLFSTYFDKFLERNRNFWRCSCSEYLYRFSLNFLRSDFNGIFCFGCLTFLSISENQWCSLSELKLCAFLDCCFWCSKNFSQRVFLLTNFSESIRKFRCFSCSKISSKIHSTLNLLYELTNKRYCKFLFISRIHFHYIYR